MTKEDILKKLSNLKYIRDNYDLLQERFEFEYSLKNVIDKLEEYFLRFLNKLEQKEKIDNLTKFTKENVKLTLFETLVLDMLKNISDNDNDNDNDKNVFENYFSTIIQDNMNMTQNTVFYIDNLHGSNILYSLLEKDLSQILKYEIINQTQEYEKENLENVKLLLKSGANPNHNDKDREENSLLCLAAENNNTMILKELVNAGADINYCYTLHGSENSPIIKSIMHGKLNNTKELLKYGAKVSHNCLDYDYKIYHAMCFICPLLINL